MVDPAVAATVAEAHRTEWAFVLAATARVTGDLDLAEECAQDAFAKALVAWEVSGVPTRPGAWLTTTARNLAIDQLRRASTLHAKTAPPRPGRGGPRVRLRARGDDRGLTTSADLHLLSPLARHRRPGGADAPADLRAQDPRDRARVPRQRVDDGGPGDEGEEEDRARSHPLPSAHARRAPSRLPSVLQVVHLVFTTGHTSPDGDTVMREDLVQQATGLARMLREFFPSDPGVAGLLGLILLTAARRDSRTSEGELVLLEDQDRSRWDRAAIEEGAALVRESIATDPPSLYAVLGAIAEVHGEAGRWVDTDWDRIIRCYDVLVETGRPRCSP